MTRPNANINPPRYELYDSVASEYQRLAADGVFSDVARDLVAALAPEPGCRVLDVGAGTGVVAAAAWESVGPSGRVVAVDLSVPMLECIGNGPPGAGAGATAITRVAGEVPGLPFHDGVFDVGASSFVLTHVRDYEASLRDMVRVIRPGGKLGITTWDDCSSEVDAAWGEVAGRYVDSAALSAAVKGSRPHQAWLSDAANFRSALEGAGLSDVKIETRDYVTDCTVDDDLYSRSTLLSGRFIRQSLPAAEWERFTAEAREVLLSRFGERVRLVRPAHVAVGKRA